MTNVMGALLASRSTSLCLVTTQQAQKLSRPCTVVIAHAGLLKAVWPITAEASPEQQLLRHAAEYLCSQPQLSDKLGVDAPPYTAELARLGQHLARLPRRKAVSGSTRKLFQLSPFFSETVCGNRDSTVLLSLNTKALRQAARDHAKAHAPTSEVTAGEAGLLLSSCMRSLGGGTRMCAGC